MALTQVQNGMLGSPQYYGFKNRIINGAMVIDQRNAGASVSTSTTGSVTYSLDRWAYLVSQASKFTIQQTSTGLAGFRLSLGCVSTASTSVGSSDYFSITQAIEGYNIADLAWGTANAKTVTLSFWVYSSLTGTFGGSLRNSAVDRSYPFSYTISSANTWTQISITIAGDTSGTWLTTNGIGIRVTFGLGMGSTFSGTAGAWASANYASATGATSVVGTNGATFYITGVQLEVGSSATSFDYRPYTTELQLCQRYLPTYEIAPAGSYTETIGMVYSGTLSFHSLPYVVTPRVPPTGLSYSGTVTNLYLYVGSGVYAVTQIILNNATLSSIQLRIAVSSGLTPGYATMLASEPSATGTIFFTGCEL